MKYVLIYIALLSAAGQFLPQNKILNVFTNRQIDFKMSSNKITTDYLADSSIIHLANGSKFDLNKHNWHFNGQQYSKYNFISTKVDFKIRGTDTIITTYSFFYDRLFEVTYYSTSIDSTKNCLKRLTRLTKRQIKPKDNFIIKSTQTNYYFDLASNKLFIIATFEPIRQYFPLWCGSGKEKDPIAQIKKRLNCN